MKSQIYLDIGNTITKWKINGEFSYLPTKDFEFEKLPDHSKIWISDVSQRTIDIIKKLNVSFLDSQEKYKSLTNSYIEPESLGSDRWFAMIASYEYSQGSNFIVIDIGTAVTIDVVDASGMHQGGVIMPGLHRIRQTFDFPVNKIEEIQMLGNSTQYAWTIGTLNLLVNSINLKINELNIEFPNARIFLSGGGYEEIKNFLNFTHEYHSNLVLDGLEFYVDNMR